MMNWKETVWAFIFFVFITLIFFYKIFFGLIPLPTDIIVGAYLPWHDYKWGYAVGVPVKNPKLSDAVSIFYPIRTLAIDSIKKGELPLWNSHMFAGYPLFGSALSGLLFPTMFFYLIFSSPIAWTLQTMSQPLFACFFMYLLLRHLKLETIPSIFGSIAFGFGGFTISWMQWNSQANVSSLLPALILFLDKYLISKEIKWGVCLSIFLCFSILAGYPPMIPFILIVLTIWYIFRVNKYHLSDIKILFFITLGVSLSAIFLMPVLELIQLSQRTVESLGGAIPFIAPENFINLIAPDFFGNPATGNFFGKGDNMDFTLYTGITTLILALLVIKSFLNKSEVRFAVCLFIIALVISLPNPISTFLYNLGFWGGSSMTMNRVNFMFNFSLALLGAYGISMIKENFQKLSLKPGLIILSLLLIVINFQTASPISLKNSILPTLLIVTVLFLILLTKKIKRFRNIAGIIFILILTLDLFRFGWKFNTFSSPDFIYPETPISEFLKQFPNDRVIAEKDIFPANMWVPFKISSVQGYDGTYPLNIAKLLAVANSGNFDAAPQPRWGVIDNFSSKIIDETNTRFLLAIKRGKEGEVVSSGQISVHIPPKYKTVFEDRGVAILENTKSLPRVYTTNKAIKASEQDTLKFMINENFPIKETSLTDNFEFNNNSTEELTSSLEYIQITNSHVLINTKTNIDSYLVVLDSFYPGWKALVDGEETEIHKTNFNFRGIVLPKGTHIVEFIYQPKSLQYGAIVSGISLLIILLLLLLPKIRKSFN